jgi:nucleoid DNA-binding protein
MAQTGFKVTVPEKLVKQVKDDLVKNGREKLTEADVKSVITLAFANIISTVEGGDSVTFTNVATFKRSLRGARVHKNPKTGEPIEKPAHYVLSMDIKTALKKHFAEIPVTAN